MRHAARGIEADAPKHTNEVSVQGAGADSPTAAEMRSMRRPARPNHLIYSSQQRYYTPAFAILYHEKNNRYFSAFRPAFIGRLYSGLQIFG
jgi:hypothetical protein